MKTLVHTTTRGTYACDYAQGEAVRIRRPYVAPRVDVLPVRVERGYSASSRTLMVGSTEGMNDNSHIDFGTTRGTDDGMVEGLGYGGTFFF